MYYVNRRETMPYLGNIPEIGELTEEKILFEFDKIPIIFVCHGSNRITTCKA